MRFEEASEFHENLSKDCKKMAALFPINEGNMDTFNSMFENSKFIYAILYNPSSSVLDSYIRSDTFYYLTNRELKRSLLSWSHIIEDYQEEEKFNADNNSQFLYPFFINESDLMDESPILTKGYLVKLQNIILFRMELLKAVVESSERDLVNNTINSIFALTKVKD